MSTAAPLSTAAQRAPAAAGVAPAVRCENCGAAVAQRYCGACGQRREPPVHSLWHFTQVATEDLTHADSRLWRTLAALLFKPGYLTAQFLAGRRASYLPPVRLYLVLSVLFFIWVSAAQTKLQVVQFDAKPAAGATRVSTPFSPALPGESAQAAFPSACATTRSTRDRAAAAGAAPCRAPAAEWSRTAGARCVSRFCTTCAGDVPVPAAARGRHDAHVWRRRHYYVEHLLLFVHNHAFAFRGAAAAAALSAAAVHRGMGTLRASQLVAV